MFRLILMSPIISLFIFTAVISGVVFAASNTDYVVENFAINAPLNGLTGEPENGRKLVIDKNKGNCLACHTLPIPEEDFHGTIGPPLTDIASRLNPAQLRLRIADMKQINPFSIMPGYYRDTTKINRIAAKYEGTTILSAQEVEDIVAYLATLKSNQAGQLQ